MEEKLYNYDKERKLIKVDFGKFCDSQKNYGHNSDLIKEESYASLKNLHNFIVRNIDVCKIEFGNYTVINNEKEYKEFLKKNDDVLFYYNSILRDKCNYQI